MPFIVSIFYENCQCYNGDALHVVRLIFSGVVDRILSDSDTDNDGYLTYAEYSKSRNTSDVVTKASRQHMTSSVTS